MSQERTLQTKRRILNKSLELFNECGVGATTTNHIASVLGMSPGNLYYHYKNKNQIIKKLIEEYQTHILNILELPQDRPVIAEDKINYFNLLSEQLWHYRFLHRDILHLVEKDMSFKESYAQFADRVMQKVRSVYQAFIEAELMHISPSELDALILNIWIVLTNWTNFLFMSGRSSDNALDEKFRLLALRQIVCLEGPYLIGESRESYELFLVSIEGLDLFGHQKNMHNE